MVEQVEKQRRGGSRQINKTVNTCVFEEFLESQLSGLPVIADIEVISPRVIRVLGKNAGQFTLQGTNTYILGTGTDRLIIDTGQGIPEWADLISSVLSTSGISLSSILLTHWHRDHTGGVPDLLRMYPHLTPSVYKHTPSRTQLPIVNGQVFSVEGATLRAVHTPGHSFDHMCFVLEEENAMFTGDNVLGHGTPVIEHLNTWMKSLRLMQSQDCVVGYPAHGGVIQNLPAKITMELAAKTRREKRVMEALAKIKMQSGNGKGKVSVTVERLVGAMHGENLDPKIRLMAVEPFTEEVLKKLAEDERVAFEMREGEKKWFAIDSAGVH